MRNTGFTITVLYIFSPISALSKGSNTYITTLCLNVHETLQIQSIEFPDFQSCFLLVFKNHIVYACR